MSTAYPEGLPAWLPHFLVLSHLLNVGGSGSLAGTLTYLRTVPMANLLTVMALLVPGFGGPCIWGLSLTSLTVLFSVA